jgi:hypothetical protein
LNRAELQNGQYGLSNANTYIPSTILGPNINPSTGELDEKRVKANLEEAISVYIQRNNQLWFNNTQVHLFPPEEGGQTKELLDR